MCQAFAKFGHKVTLIARKPLIEYTDIFNYYGISEHFEIVWLRCPTHKLGGVIYALAIRQWVMARGKPDLIYGRSLVGLLALVHTKVPIGYEVHVPPRTFVHKLLEGYLLKQSTFSTLFTISQALRNEYLRLFPWFDSNRIYTVPDAADPLPENVLPISPWPGRKGHLQVGYVGHLYRGKGMELIIPLACRLPEMDFHIIGGTDEDLDYWKSLNIPRNLYFHGFVPHKELAKYFARLDVLLAPLQQRVTVCGKGDIARWTSPLKIFEYMAAGKAIVASDLPVLREVFRHEVNAFLCPPEDVSAWEHTLKILQHNPDIRRKLGEAAKAEFLSKYTWTKRAEVILEAFGC